MSGRAVRAVLALLALTGLVLLPAGSASAGGPTSVLLVVPGEGRTASLYTSQPEYQELLDLVGGPGGAPSGTPGGGPPAPSMTGVTLTWLIHDIMVWRVDRVHRGPGGAAWIETQQDLSGSGAVGTPVWHTAARGEQLFALLDRLGVDPDHAPYPGAAPTASTAAAAMPSSAPGRTPGRAPGWAPGWAWAWSWPAAALLGLGAGVALTRPRHHPVPPVTPARDEVHSP